MVPGGHEPGIEYREAVAGSALDRSCSPEAAPPRASRCRAPSGLPAASTRAAAVREAIGILPRLSLPPFDTRD
jgi:hypothetical protein